MPTALSVGMSRRLFTMSSAHASSPTGTASQSTLASSRSCWTNAVPPVATSPKNTNTETSPSPLAAYGFGPPEYSDEREHGQAHRQR